MDVAGQEHFESNKGENDGEPDVKVSEQFDQAGDSKVEGAQAEDGKGVGGKDNERVAGDGKNCGDRIDRENEIGGAKGDEDKEEGSAGPAPLFTKKEAVPMKIGCDGDEFPSQPNQRVMVGFDFRFPTFEEFDSGVDEKSAKKVDQPMKAID